MAQQQRPVIQADPTQLARELMREVRDEQRPKVKPPFDINKVKVYDPSKVDIRKMAEDLAAKHGRRLTQWTRVDASEDMWMARCMDTGDVATCRWRQRPTNDPRKDEESMWFYPSFGGAALNKPKSGVSRERRATETIINAARPAG